MKRRKACCWFPLSSENSMKGSWFLAPTKNTGTSCGLTGTLAFATSCNPLKSGSPPLALKRFQPPKDLPAQTDPGFRACAWATQLRSNIWSASHRAYNPRRRLSQGYQPGPQFCQPNRGPTLSLREAKLKTLFVLDQSNLASCIGALSCASKRLATSRHPGKSFASLTRPPKPQTVRGVQGGNQTRKEGSAVEKKQRIYGFGAEKHLSRPMEPKCLLQCHMPKAPRDVHAQLSCLPENAVICMRVSV